MKLNSPLSVPIARIAFVAMFWLSLCFAQEGPQKLAVYVSGAGDAAINKSLGQKLLVAMTQNGDYAEIADPGAFHEELAKSGKNDLVSVSKAANRYGSDWVCVVSMIEVFDAYSITARLARASDASVVKTAQTDRALKSLEDLNAVVSELARQLLPTYAMPPPLAALPALTTTPPPESVPPSAVAAEPKQCERKYNVNELLYKIKNGFPSKLKDCSGTLAKDMLTPASLGGHKLVPAQFMTQCPVDAIKKELPDGFPGVDKFLVKLTNFVQTLMNSAMAGGSLDPKKLLSVVASMDINGLLNEAKKLSDDECVVDEPYDPPPASDGEYAEGDSEDKKDNRSVYFGIRGGYNFSHAYMEQYDSRVGDRNGSYNDIGGMQLGFVIDIAATNWFHIQPGLMYMQKGMQDKDGSSITSHNIDILALLSIKASVLRLNAGPYLGFCVSGEYVCNMDFGLSTGFGFDIGMFYLGLFYDYGLSSLYSVGGGGSDGYSSYSYDRNLYNRTLGFNLGVNL